MRERFRMITAVPRSVSRLCQGAFWTLAVTLVVLSYSFVLQPSFDPPMEDIYTDSSVHEINPAEEYILKHKGGSYSLVLSTGEMIPLNEETVIIFVSQGTKITEER